MVNLSKQATLEYLFPETSKWLALQNGLRAFPGSGYILVTAASSLLTVNSGIFGGGINHRRYFINRQVEKDYTSDCPADEMADYLASQFASYKPAAKSEWAALMTAARVVDACWLKVTHQDCQVNVIITAGVNNACSAGVTPYCVSASGKVGPGTINTMAFINRALTPGALVNAVQTMTEAKTQTLRELNITCPVTGAFASGTNTDATLIAAAADTIPCEYTGPGTLIGYMLALGVRGALTQAVKSYLEAGSY
ncbi:MAG: adenosylcobinamide amidohydrolase [Desulfotomaculaceae bacterium]|nr:adenosylcobinamide amidohydrolase [Desulfotomaculaceae bacterium]MDD4767158.1 adenosylcobinamide amidohydrolase [Desulfotomaculaceae bacterium]